MLRHASYLALSLATVLFSVQMLHALPNAFYYFDDPPGSEEAVDSSRSGLNVKITKDSYVASQDPRFGTGYLKIERGKAAATSGWYVPLNKRPEFAEAVSQMTVTVWLRRVNAQAVTTVRRSQSEENAAGVFSFRIDRFNRLVFSAGQLTAQTLPLDSLSGDGWIHLAVAFDEGRTTLYVDGEEAAYQELEITEIPTAPIDGSLSLGLHAPEGTSMDDLGIFGSALKPEQIREIYQKGLEQFVLTLQ